MTWTEERVETLKKLWIEGLSASQIAGVLGGVTRNAVIGKVHRLGLSGRAKSSSTSRIRKPRAPRRLTSGGASTGGSATGSHGSTIAAGRKPQRSAGAVIGNVALSPMASPQAAQETAQVQELYIAPENRADIMALTETRCRWPIGDPTHDDFYFCGGTCDQTKPYCEFHSNIAYHKPHERKRR